MPYAPDLEVGMKALLPAPNREDWTYLFLCRSQVFEQETLTRWDIPGGRVGKALGDVSLHEGLAREVREEMGGQLAIEPGNFPLLLRRQLIYRQPTSFDVVRFTNLAQIATAQVQLSPEHTDYTYATRQEALDLNIDVRLREVLQDDALFAFEAQLPSTATMDDVRNTMLRA